MNQYQLNQGIISFLFHSTLLGVKNVKNRDNKVQQQIDN